MAGYSGTPLAKKLGIRDGQRGLTLNEPPDYLRLIGPIPDGVRLSSRFRKDVDLCHYFTRQAADLKGKLPKLKNVIRQNGMIWVSWPKKASGVTTDVTEDIIRDVALPIGLVDVKVCAVDETWSGLKLVIRKELRTGI